MNNTTMSLGIEKLPTNLITDDGEPMESNNHRISMNLLIQSLKYHWRDRQDFFVGGNMFVYYSANQVKNQDFKGPDFFVVLDVDGTINRDAWIAWEEDSRLPDVVIELMSPSTAEIDLTTKKDIYERKLKTQDYFVYDPNNATSLRGWTLINRRRYKPLNPNDQGRLYCQSLDLWLGVWQGKIENTQGNWLRFFDADGNLVLMGDEAETQRAERLAAKLRELGINPDEI
ncbi:Uma2 family endonuclease [Kamptonema sp. UHCC 0994]|uniref:Uma2 family endonuclease n=1 Tax=Kamptonema sp. UHCC 0994 TaxID=3031329 RepID=UPI0023BAC54A|nr:Uma2 family endonuclease [Kamptonema sp. UHCC 0994]MDF0556192.1 Uma2 family endonuclease [Kamptonema sp. UHCC 0994]